MGAELRPLWALIDLDALAMNYQNLCALAGSSRVCAVVKADGYGHGAIGVAKALFESGCRDFAVALVDEGVELREAGVDGEILVLSEPGTDSFDVAAKYDISVTLYTPNAIKIANTATFGESYKRLSVQLKVDTGMFRVGASLADLDGIVGSMHSGDLEAVWSHFAVADLDDDASVEFTHLQIERFHQALQLLASKGIAPRQVHMSNTAGLLNYPGARFTKVRVGLGLYGYSPVLAQSKVELTPVLSLVSEVMFLKEVAEGERPSYGRRRPLAGRSVIATIPIGYADGLPRALFENGGEVLINGTRYPIAGTVTMDQILVDLGPNPSISTGDKVVLIGRSNGDTIGADEWAARCSTITWEILCGISKRVPRRFLSGIA